MIKPTKRLFSKNDEFRKKQTEIFPLTIETIAKVAKIAKSSGLGKLKLAKDDEKLELQFGADTIYQPLTPEAAPPAAQPMPGSTEVSPAVTSSPPPQADSEKPERGLVVKSPMIGTVYLASSPGADPFIKVGDRVSEGQTILIVEAMKVMNQITAPVDGVIAEILVDNQQPIEYGEELVVYVK